MYVCICKYKYIYIDKLYIYVSECSGKYDFLLRKIGWEKMSGYFFQGDILFCCLEVVFMFSG